MITNALDFQRRALLDFGPIDEVVAIERPSNVTSRNKNKNNMKNMYFVLAVMVLGAAPALVAESGRSEMGRERSHSPPGSDIHHVMPV